MVSNISQGTGSSLFDMLRSMQKEQAAQALETVGAQTASFHAASSSSMSCNFYNSNYERSGHVQSTIDGRRLYSEYFSRMNSMLNSLAGQAIVWDSQRAFGGVILIENTYINGMRLTTAAGQAASQMQQWEASESAGKNLDEIKDDTENKAQEAAAPTNANGDAIEAGTTGGAGETGPMPEVSGSNQAPGVATVAVSAPEVATRSAPSTPSIDITV